jgi:hypothetical protein
MKKALFYMPLQHSLFEDTSQIDIKLSTSLSDSSITSKQHGIRAISRESAPPPHELRRRLRRERRGALLTDFSCCLSNNQPESVGGNASVPAAAR